MKNLFEISKNALFNLVKSTPKSNPMRAIALNNNIGRYMGDKKKGLLKPTSYSFKMLRQVASVDAIIRISINVIKKTVAQSKWQIKVKDRYRKDKNAEKLYSKEIEQIYELFDNMNDNDENVRMLLERVIEDILTIDAGCLYGGEFLELKDGNKYRIADIVEKEIQGEILSYNETTKKTEYKKINGWHKNKLNGRKWVKVNYSNARNMGRHGRKSTWFTDDHKLLTVKGWKEIKDITNEEVVTSWIKPNKLQEELFNACVLGDGHLQGRKGSYRRSLSLGHSIKQEQWLDTKVQALNCFTFNRKTSNRGFGKDTTNLHTFISELGNTSPWIEKESHNWLDSDFKKVVPSNLKITPLLLATWYMDDGHGCKNPYGQIASYFNSCGFSLEEQEGLVKKLNNFGIKCNVQKAGKFYRIYNTVEGTKTLFNIISKYIVPDLRYKLKGFKGDDFDENMWNLGEPDTFTDTIIKEYGNPAGRKNKIPMNTYCIDVEDNHNFATSDIIAHNCIEIVRSIDGKTITQLNSVDGATLKPIVDKYGNILSPAYKQYIDDLEVAEFDKNEMMYIMANPQNSVELYGYGISPIESVMLQVQASMEAEMYNMKTFSSNNIPAGMLDLGDVGDDEAENVMATWNATVIGNTEAMKFIWGQGASRKFTPFQKSNKDMQFSQYIDWLSRMKLATFGLTAQDANITQDVNKSTAEVYAAMSNTRGVRSMKRLIEEYFTRKIVRVAGESENFKKIEFAFIDIETLEDREIQAKVDKINIESGIYQPQYVQERDGYPILKVDIDEDYNNKLSELIESNPIKEEPKKEKKENNPIILPDED